MNMLEFIQREVKKMKMTKSEFGRMVHSDNDEDIEIAIEAMMMAGGYENLED